MESDFILRMKLIYVLREKITNNSVIPIETVNRLIRNFIWINIECVTFQPSDKLRQTTCHKENTWSYQKRISTAPAFDDFIRLKPQTLYLSHFWFEELKFF